MNLYLKNVTVGFIALFLCFPLIFHFVYADKSSTQLGARFNVPEEEIDADISMTNLIGNYSISAGYDAYNWYGSSTNSSSIYCAAGGVSAQHSITFYIGESRNEYLWNWWGPIPFWEQQWFISDDSGNKVYDKDIFPHSGSQYLEFAFLWSCQAGDTVGGTHWSGTPFGIPYALLHNASISDNGYVNPDGGGQAFLGFAGFIYGLADPFDGDYFQEFLNKFYFSALCYGGTYSINGALDYASRLTWNVGSFEDVWLYKGYDYIIGWDPVKKERIIIHGQMKVYGDGNMHIGERRPVMKTEADGNFYVPSVSAELLRIGMLFNEALVGDQTGGTSPYPGISDYPDGYVELMDLFMISGRFGAVEGDEDWNYMADIVPDRCIELMDYFAVSNHMFNSGTYITNLSAVTVTFDTGDVISPNCDGFVTIPQNATSFTVKRYGNSIGALVIFW